MCLLRPCDHFWVDSGQGGRTRGMASMLLESGVEVPLKKTMKLLNGSALLFSGFLSRCSEDGTGFGVGGVLGLCLNCLPTLYFLTYFTYDT